MTGCGTANITGTPTLTHNEIDTMKKSALFSVDLLRSLRASTNTDGRIEVFGVSPDARIWHTWQVQPNGRWNERG